MMTARRSKWRCPMLWFRSTARWCEPTWPGRSSPCGRRGESAKKWLLPRSSISIVTPMPWCARRSSPPWPWTVAPHAHRRGWFWSGSPPPAVVDGRRALRRGAGDVVVPVAVPVMLSERDGGVVGVGDLLAGRIPVRVIGALHGEPGGGLGRGDQLDDSAQVGEGTAPPVHRDEAEQPVLDPVPLRGAGRVVAHGDGQPGVGGQSREVPLPGSDPIAVGPAGVGGD